MRLVGFIAGQESPRASDLVLTFDELQRLMDSWKLDRLLKVFSETASFTIPSGQDTFTVGPTGDLVMETPMNIVNAWSFNGSQDIPIGVMADTELWRSWRDQNAMVSYPKYFRYAYSEPNATIQIYPKCNQPINFQFGYDVNPTIPQTLGDTVTVQPGWMNALVYNLASAIILPLNIPINEQVERIEARAAEYRAKIKRHNIVPTPRAIIDPSLQRGRYSSAGTRWGYNVNADQFNGIS